jgi:hypothetical protein
MTDNKIIYQLEKIIDLQEENINLRFENKQLNKKNKKYVKNISELEEKILILEEENKNNLRDYKLLSFKYSIISSNKDDNEYIYDRNYSPSCDDIHTFILDVYENCKHLKNKEYKEYMYDFYKVYRDLDILKYIHAYCLLNRDNIDCDEK